MHTLTILFYRETINYFEFSGYNGRPPNPPKTKQMLIDKMPEFITRSLFINVPAVLAAAQFQFADAAESQGSAALDQETYWTNQSINVKLLFGGW